MSEPSAAELPKDAALNAIVQIHDRLLEVGDNVFRSLASPARMSLKQH
jgi:hypothetical protein